MLGSTRYRVVVLTFMTGSLLNRMKHFFTTTIVFMFAIVACNSAHAQRGVESVYSDLRPSKCRTLEVNKETGATVQRCPGVAGYKLLALDDDSRQSITVVDPAGKEHELDLWNVVTLSFSSLGEKAEWRVIRRNRKMIPRALIVRLNASEDPESPRRLTSYLAVAKISSDKVCVTNKIRSGPGGNQAAKRAADAAANAPCLQELK